MNEGSNPNPAASTVAPAASSMPAPKVAIKLPPPVITPMAWRLTNRPRDLAIKAIQEFKPDGNPKSELLSIARELALKLIEAHPEDVNGIEAIIEIGGGAAHQINVIVIPHRWG